MTVRRIVLLAAFLVASAADLPVAAASPPPTDGDKLVREGIEALERGDFEGALAKFTNAQVEDPQSDELHFDIGMALYKLERWGDAEKALTNALFSSDKAIESKSAFHLANCAVKQGKYKDALRLYDRALEVDPEFESAKVNREWVVRKVKELARKQKDAEDKQKQERAIIEKLGEIIKKQGLAHAGVRHALRFLGKTPPSTPVREMDSMLDRPLEADAVSPFSEPGVEERARGEFGKVQDEILADTDALIEEVRSRIAAAAAPPAAQPGAPPAGAAAPDPEVEALKSAQPFLDAAMPHLEAAIDGLGKRSDWQLGHDGQQEALLQLFKALHELEDELTRIIQDQVQVLKDTTRASEAAPKSPAEELGVGADSRPASRPNPAGLVPEDDDPEAAALPQRQKALRQRTDLFAQGLESHVQQMQRQAAEQAKQQGARSGTPPTPVGEDPETQIKRFETALTHLRVASEQMGTATLRLEAEDMTAAIEPERQALEELIKAKTLMSPPSEEGEDGDKKDGEKQEKKEGDGSEGDKGDQGDQKDGDQKGKDKKAGKMDGADDKSKAGDKDEKLSKDQAQKMLERARQKERDRRKEDNEAAQRAADPRGATQGKDW